jgi:dTDP-4-dehydrorhamnose 3,5-epimerase
MYNDPRLGLNWPLQVSVISEKDQNFRVLEQFESELRKKMKMERAYVEG